MADSKIPDATLLRQMLKYDPETGKLFHASRPREMFANRQVFVRWEQQNVGREAFTTVTSCGYLRGKIFGKGCLAHRVIWKMVHGAEPDSIDHINGDRTDNRLANLRNVAVSDNMVNRKTPSTNTSGVCGVFWNDAYKRWQASIVKDGKRRQKRFSTFAEAVAWRKELEVSLGFHPNHGR